MRMFVYGFMAIGLWFAYSAQADVYRCEDPEQGIIFQQTPCPEPEAEITDESSPRGEESAPDASQQGRPVVGRDENVADVVAAQEERQRQSLEVEACKQQFRDAIDAIDVEIQNSYTPEQREYYLERLKALTEQMSAC